MKESKSFSEFYSQESPVPFYVMVGLFVFSNMLMVVNFIDPVVVHVITMRLAVDTVLLVGCAMYIALNLLLWKMEPVTVAAAVGIIAFVGFGWNFIGHTNEFFCTIVAAMLALLAYQRDFRVVMKIVMVCHIVTMIVAALGLPFGYTELVYKVATVDVGYSLGLIYSNHVGRMAFLILMIAWYLWGQEKVLVSMVVGVTVALVMWFVIECKTITLFLVGFPLCWWIIRLYKAKGEEYSNPNPAIAMLKKIGQALLLAMPFLCMLFTYILGLFRTFFLEHWHFGQPIYALWMRFISAGILFKVYGFPLLGRDILNENGILEVKDGQYYIATIVDNAYVYYMIAIGGIALIACMLWFCFGMYRAMKNQDAAIQLMYFFMCGYGILEVVLFQFEHNFLFFYPLTATALAYKNLAKDDDDPGNEIEARNEEKEPDPAGETGLGSGPGQQEGAGICHDQT